ncbi:MAG TPA: CpsD/CapB family tyrosine-protein kinase [Dehalococcoidia bacterium]|nr:CpsD/CapB family tyrosine-protein kinase [Dehalococcoidia bacterium]
MTQAIRQFAASRLSSRRQVVLGVASPTPGEGCTTVALSLATALADIHGNVLYVEAERSSKETLQEEAGYVVSGGLCAYLRKEASLEDSILLTGKKGLSILPAGRETDGVSALERLTGLSSLFGTLRESFDVTVVDLPPLLTSEDSPALLSSLDGVVLVVSAGRSELADVKNSLSLCGPVQLEGIIVNRSVRKTPGWLASLFTTEGQRGLA